MLTFQSIRRRIHWLVLPLFLVAVGCQDDTAVQRDMMAMTVARNAPVPAAVDHAGKGVALGNASAVRRPSEEQQASTPPFQQVAPTGMVIRNGNVSIQVDSLEAGIDGVRQLAASLGGFIGDLTMMTGEHQVRTASLQMKIPAARFDDAMNGMAPLGTVESSTTTAEDVGEEFVDVTARVANSKRLEARLVALLAQRTGKLEDVLAVERELARVREEIERYEGRIRFLSARVATSTIVATVHEKAPLVAASPGTNIIGQAFINMWRNFVALVAGAISVSGILIPFAAMGWLLLWRLKRRREVKAA